MRWLEFKVIKPCKHESDVYEGCPLCEIKELEAELADWKRGAGIDAVLEKSIAINKALQAKLDASEADRGRLVEENRFLKGKCTLEEWQAFRQEQEDD